MVNIYLQSEVKMNKTYLFDFDGTLVDSMPTFISSMLRILDENNINYAQDIVKIITPLGYRGTAEYFRSLGIKTPTDELVALMHDYMREKYLHSILAKTHVIETLNALHGVGASLNILTASPHEVLDPCLKRLGIFELFDNVWSCEDFKTTKANPEIYKMAAEKIGCRENDVIFVDDNIGAVSTAKRAGLIAYGIYDDSSADLIDKMREVSDRYIMTLSELLD